MSLRATALGVDAFDSTPSSSVVVVREYRDKTDNYFRKFFCQNFSIGSYQIVLANDKCFLDHSSVGEPEAPGATLMI